MSHLAERLATAKAEGTAAEAEVLAEIERRLKWHKPPGISARDLWRKLGSQGDVAALTRRLEALREDGRAVLVGELWHHGSATPPHTQVPPAGGNVTTPQVSDGVAARRARILELLAAHPEGLRHGQVVDIIGASGSTIHNDLMRLRVLKQAAQDHSGVWRLVPPPMQATVEIVAEGEVVATVVEPEPEPDARPDPLALLADLAAAVETLERARREIAEHTADALIGDTLDEIAAYVGAPDYTDPAEVYRAVVAREEDLTGRLYAAREEASALRTEIERVRAALRVLAAGGGS